MPTELVETIDLPGEPDTYLGTVEGEILQQIAMLIFTPICHTCPSKRLTPILLPYKGTLNPSVANIISLEVSSSAVYPSMLNTGMALIAASTSPVSSDLPPASLLTSSLSSNVAPNSALSPWSGDYLSLNGHYESPHVPLNSRTVSEP